MSKYDTPDGVHENLTVGGVALYRNDYDGPYLEIVYKGKGYAVHAERVEKALIQMLESCEEHDQNPFTLLNR